MDAYRYLLDLAIILLSTKVLGLLTKKVQMPQVVGALLAGLILGPAGFGLLTETSFIHEVAEIGVIVLMFSAGMEKLLLSLHYLEYLYRWQEVMRLRGSSINRVRSSPM